MTNYSNDLTNHFLQDEELLPLETIMLSSDQIDQAMQLSDPISNPAEQWQVYLQILARLGFQQWLQERIPRFTVTVLPNHQLQVGAFKLCIVAIGSFTDELIAIPKVAVDNPDSMPHFYVLIEVLEEQEQVRICGYLRQDEVIQRRKSSVLRAEGKDSYLFPLDWFELNTDELLLYLQHLDPAAIALPIPVSSSLINVGLWLRNQLDAIADDLSWVLLPPPTYASAMRSARGTNLEVEQFDGIMAALLEQGVDISSQARGAYRDVQLGNDALRLYVVTWEISHTDPAEWTLLAILGTQSGELLPSQIKLKIRDEEKLLDEQVLLEHQQTAYLYTQVFGVLNEQFRVAIETVNGEVLTLPPFTLSGNGE